MPATTTRYGLAGLTAPQWRLLNRLYTRDRATTPATDCRGLLSKQEASTDDLLALNGHDLVEGVVPGTVIDLDTINWHVALRRRNYVGCRITAAGKGMVFKQGEMVLMRSIGRRRRVSIHEACRVAGIGTDEARDVLQTLNHSGLIVASGDDGQPVPLEMFKRGSIPTTLRLSLTRKGGTFLERR